MYSNLITIAHQILLSYPICKKKRKEQVKKYINKIHGGSYSLREEKKQVGQKELVYEEK